MTKYNCKMSDDIMKYDPVVSLPSVRRLERFIDLIFLFVPERSVHRKIINTVPNGVEPRVSQHRRVHECCRACYDVSQASGVWDAIVDIDKR